jgi:acyl-CoA reductase-like NAD-dependent aldehyde dehydrogenase
LPHGVFNLVMGRGSEVGEAILQHPAVAAVSFTGSIETGRKVAAACTSATPMKKFQLEMGGKNPFVVLDDADLTIAVDCAMNGAYFSTGQRCTASSRLIVTAGIHDRFVDGLTDRLKKLVVDDALKPGTEMGPVVDENQLDQDLRYLDVGKSEGARLHWGGERLNRENPGFYLQPALYCSRVDGSGRPAPSLVVSHSINPGCMLPPRRASTKASSSFQPQLRKLAGSSLAFRSVTTRRSK